MWEKQHCSIFVCVWESPWRRLLSLYLGLESQPSLPLSLWSSCDSTSPYLFHFSPLRTRTQGEKFSILIYHFVPPLFPPSREDGWMCWEFGWGRERRPDLCITLSLHQWRRGSRLWGKGTCTHTLERQKSFECCALSLSAQLVQVCCCGCSCAGLIPRSVYVCARCARWFPYHTLETPLIDQGIRQESWVSGVCNRINIPNHPSC